MKCLRIMGILGIICSAICFVFIVAFLNPLDYMAAGGWGMYACLYLLAISIVAVVKNPINK